MICLLIVWWSDWGFNIKGGRAGAGQATEGTVYRWTDSKLKKIKKNKIEVQTDHWEESEKQPSDVRPNIPTTDCNVSQRDSLLVVCVSMCLCDSPSDVTKGWGGGRRQTEPTLTPNPE